MVQRAIDIWDWERLGILRLLGMLLIPYRKNMPHRYTIEIQFYVALQTEKPKTNTHCAPYNTCLVEMLVQKMEKVVQKAPVIYFVENVMSSKKDFLFLAQDKTMVHLNHK